jgi:hypothetical protein
MRRYSKRLKTLADLRRFLAAKITALDAGELDESRLRTFAYALTTLAAIIRDSDLEQRLEKLEKQAAENQPGRMGK